MALKSYIASGWTIRIIPWVVEPGGLVHEQSLQDALEFLEIPRGQRSQIVRDTVRASVEALTFMCRLRSLQNRPPPHAERLDVAQKHSVRREKPARQRTFDTDDPQPSQLTNAADQNLSRKRKAATPKESLA